MGNGHIQYSPDLVPRLRVRVHDQVVELLLEGADQVVMKKAANALQKALLWAVIS